MHNDGQVESVCNGIFVVFVSNPILTSEHLQQEDNAC